MKTKWIMTAVVAVAVGFSATVQAVQITGSIDMNGTAVLNSSFLGSATAATSFSGTQVAGVPTGSFAGVAFNTPVTWSAFSWPSAVAVSPLWSFVSGGSTYTFDLNNVSVVSQDNAFLNLSGNGVLKISGGTYDDTPGDWSFTISNAGGGEHANFSFSFANSNTSVPDGGTTVMLLGGALTGLGLLRKKLFVA